MRAPTFDPSLRRPLASVSAPVSGDILQRCGAHACSAGDCARPEDGSILRRSSLQPTHSSHVRMASVVPQFVHDVLRTSGRPLQSEARVLMESQLGYDFTHVRVHDDVAAGESATALNARAYAVSPHVVFGPGQYNPHTVEGRRLLTHELVHIAQSPMPSSSIPQHLGLGPPGGSSEQEAEVIAGTHGLTVGPGDQSSARRLTRVNAPFIGLAKLGTQVTHPTGSKSPFKKVEASFDGAEFVAVGDKKEIQRVSAQSGRPLSVPAGEVTACKGTKGDTYLNNPRYVGIKDNGPIPEGEYKFLVTNMTTFSVAERYQMLLGGHDTDPRGMPLHGGDWGSGRVQLRPVHVLPSKFCGDTSKRSGFFLHGGIMPGSSGCIDIGNSGFDDLVHLLVGHRAEVHVFVKYTHAPPSVSAGTRALGRFTYPGKEDPDLLDRLKAVVGGDDE